MKPDFSTQDVSYSRTSTLTTPPLLTILARLFAESDAVDESFDGELARQPGDARAAFRSRAKTDYAAFYGEAKDLFLAVSRETATLLYLLARASKAKAIVEFGTSFGLSTLHLAAALKDNGGGRLVGSELVASKAEQARKNLAEAGLAELAEIREGDALQTFARDLPTPIDLVLLDGAKVLYPRILALLEPRLAPGALLVADNADESPEYLERVRSPGAGYLSAPFAADVELSMRLA